MTIDIKNLLKSACKLPKVGHYRVEIIPVAPLLSENFYGGTCTGHTFQLPYDEWQCHNPCFCPRRREEIVDATSSCIHPGKF